MSEPRLGEPVELPWWVVPLGLPPLVVAVAAVFLGAPLWARALTVLSSLAMLLGIAVIASRVDSRSMQSVWISAAYAVWVFIVVVWAVIVATGTQ